MKPLALTLLAVGVAVALWDRNWTAATYAVGCIILIADLRWGR